MIGPPDSILIEYWLEVNRNNEVKVLVIGINKGNGCDNLQIFCKDEHVGDLLSIFSTNF